ncbi:MAG: DNA adenine methylase [bacterium]
MIKSPLRYPGGKSRAVKFLTNFIPPKFNEFREPFFGGGSLSFYYVQNNPDLKYYASDINYELYCFWQELKNNPEKIIEEILKIKNEYTDGKTLFNDLILKANNNLPNFERAVRFFILNRITFSGVVDSGGYSEGAYRNRFTLSSIDRLKQAYEVIEKIHFSSNDYTELLFKPGKDVFLFLDPPYYSATKSRLYGKNGKLHINFNHEEFLENLKKCEHKWLVTYDNSEFIKELFKDFYIFEWELQYGMNNYKKDKAEIGRELLVANYDISSTLV